MFKCKVCSEKDKRIQDLRDEIVNLRKLVFPANDPTHIPALSMELDSVLSGKEDMIPLNRVQSEEFERAIAERDALLSGNYDNSQEAFS